MSGGNLRESAPVRVVSLVPSLTAALAALGVADCLVGVTDYCRRGAPSAAARVGGTKFPSVDAVLALDPDLVLANREENRAEDVAALRAAGVEVLVTYPRAVADVAPMLRAVGTAVGASPSAVERAAGAVEEAAAVAERGRPAAPVPVVALIWRKPWMGVGTDTYVDDLLACSGFANLLGGLDGRYPRLDAETVRGLHPRLVLLPSEPYAFDVSDLPAVHELFGRVATRFVDGELLTWHGPDTAAALSELTAVARASAAAGGRHPSADSWARRRA